MKNGWWRSNAWTTGETHQEQGVSIDGGKIDWIFHEDQREDVLGTAFQMPKRCQTSCDRTHVTYATGKSITWFWYFAGFSQHTVKFYYREEKKVSASAHPFSLAAVDMKNGWWHSSAWTTGELHQEQGVSIDGGEILWIFGEAEREDIFGKDFQMQPRCSGKRLL